MNKEYSQEELLHKAAAYCSTSEHCISEIEEKLRKWGANNEQTQAILDRLTDEGFIDEERYCIAFVKDKFRFNKWGKVKISYFLKQKGCSSDQIRSALLTIEDNQYEVTLADLLKAKLNSIKWETEFERNGKLFNYAQSKGFEHTLIMKTIGKLESSKPSDFSETDNPL